jgi:hypothetical protein
MIKMDAPDLLPSDVFAECISRIRDPGLKLRMVAISQLVVAASADFNRLATQTRLHQFVRQAVVGGIVTAAEMEVVYTQRMAKKSAPGRDAYDELFNSAPNGKCPLCGHRAVSTLDHHLPKAHYPVLAVVPLNLVPACGDCNKSKLAALPTNANQEAMHPYFDNIDGDRWLFAEVVIGTPAALRFRVHAPTAWNAVLAERVALHFKTLGLGALYSAESADELLNIRGQLEMIHEAGGAALVETELRERASSCRGARMNGWRTAAFDAFADSAWFCDGGFRLH